MKNKLCIYYFVIILVSLQCTQKSSITKSTSTSYSAEVNYIGKETNGVVILNSYGYGKNEEDAIIDAQKNAFNILLFKGLPGTDFNLPLVDNEFESKSKNKQYYETFFILQHYKKHIMSSIIATPLTSSNQTKKISINIKINNNSLRKDLEQNSIIRKFGY